MSTSNVRRFRRQLLHAVLIFVAPGLLAARVSAQQPDITIRLLPDSHRVAVEVNTTPASEWSFVDSYAGIVGLGRRIDQFAAFDESGSEVTVTQSAPGQFRSDRRAKLIRYNVDIHPVSRGAGFSMISWIEKDRGVLLPLDLLPVLTSQEQAVAKNRRVAFQLPDSWSVRSGEAKVSQSEFAMADADRAVFAVGVNLRSSETALSGLTLTFVTNSDWAFSDAEALELSQQVLKGHRETFGSLPGKSATFVLFPFPLAVSSSQWSAETRGATVTLIMGRLPSKVAALAQLSTPLTHEFFHLWIPNALALKGNYDWFYEGFTTYQAAQTTLKLGLLSFQQFLDAMARAYDASKEENSLSLIEASGRRFTGGLNSVYAKSELVAFLYDLRLRSASHNKRSLADVYRRLLRSSNGGRDGGETVASALSDELGSQDFVGSFVRKPVSINLVSELAPFGLIADTSGFRTRISVSEKLNKQQRDLLRELGYNAATHAPR